MSRSYKKTPMAKVADKRPKDWKEIYNRKLRRSNKVDYTDESTWDAIPNGNSYKRMNEPYNICDYRDSATLDRWISFNPTKDMKQNYRDWYTIYKAK